MVGFIFVESGTIPYEDLDTYEDLENYPVFALVRDEDFALGFLFI